LVREGLGRIRGWTQDRGEPGEGGGGDQAKNFGGLRQKTGRISNSKWAFEAVGTRLGGGEWKIPVGMWDSGSFKSGATKFSSTCETTTGDWGKGKKRGADDLMQEPFRYFLRARIKRLFHKNDGNIQVGSRAGVAGGSIWGGPKQVACERRFELL